MVSRFDNSTTVKYTFSPSSTQCQPITNINYEFSHLMLSSVQFFLLGVDSSYTLHMYKVIFSSTSVNWANKIVCSSGACTSNESESQLSADGTSICLFFMYGSTNYLYFASLSTSTGSVIGTRYKSSISSSPIYGSALSGDYIVATAYIYLVVYRISSSTFTIKSFTGLYLYECGVEPSTGRFIINGHKGGSGYTSKFTMQPINYLPDFPAASWSMNALSAGTDNIISESSITIGSVATLTPVSSTYSNVTVTYVQGSITTTDIYYYDTFQSISAVELNTLLITPDISCSYSGSISIIYSISNYGSSSSPQWVSINSATGELTINAPSVNADTESDFYVNSLISVGSINVQKLIKLTVINCQVQNCQKCSSSSGTTCSICNSGYTLSSGSCIIPIIQNSSSSCQNASSETANAIRITFISILCITICLSILLSCSSSSSIAYLWLMVNQMQMLFILFLLLTRSFIPQDIKTVIQGAKYALNIYEYIPINKIEFIESIFSKFNFSLTNTSLKDIGMNSDSSIYNTYPIIVCFLYMVLLRLLLFCIQKCESTENENSKCQRLANLSKMVAIKLYNILTFAFFIRNFIEISLFVIISAMNEIYNFIADDFFHVFSFLYALFILIFYLLMIGFVFYLIYSSYTLAEDQHNKLEEFFVNHDQLKWSRAHTAVFLIRRIVYTAIVIFMVSVPAKAVVCVLAVIQFGYVIYIALLRPNCEIKANVIEILNELNFFVLVFLLIFLSKENDWNSASTAAYMWIITSNILLIFLIILCKLLDNTFSCLNKLLNYKTEVKVRQVSECK